MDPTVAFEAYEPYFSRDSKTIKRDLESLENLVLKWQRVQNLVSRETLDQIWSRHILDSLQILPVLLRGRSKVGATTDHGAVQICDIGSGGGFPALPLAIALKGADIRFHLVESNGRKCAFLNAVGRELSLDIVVHNARIEALDAENLGSIHAFTSRALAPMPLLFSYLHHLWTPGAVAVIHKGQEFGEELGQADSVWSYDVLKHNSQTDPNGVLLEIRNLTQRSS